MIGIFQKVRKWLGFDGRNPFCRKLPLYSFSVPEMWRKGGHYLMFEEHKFLSGLQRLPTDEELVSGFAKMVGKTKMKFDTIMIYRWSGTVRTTRIQTNPGDTPYPAKTEDIVSTFFDLSFGNSIRGVSFIGVETYYDIVIYVEESKDGTTNITPLFMDFIHGFMESHRSQQFTA